jgi:putative dimethyl sulfoxide reductase chaperone
MKNMQTQFEPAPTASQTETPRRSVYGNYSVSDTDGEMSPNLIPDSKNPVLGIQASLDLAIARSFLYRALAQAFEEPSQESWLWLCQNETRQVIHLATMAFREHTGTAIQSSSEKLVSQFKPTLFEDFTSDYLSAFGHAARGPCPINEIEYGDLKADPLFQPHRLADLGAFYRAFGLELSTNAGERHDHLCLELEFMSVLAAKEAYAIENQLEEEQLAVCLDAQKKFLREHLGRWTPAFARRLTGSISEGPLSALAEFTRQLIEADCQWVGVKSGSEDLFLRPVDENEESLCASCGITNLPPGANPGPESGA